MADMRAWLRSPAMRRAAPRARNPGSMAVKLVTANALTHELTETRRFTNDWEGPASLRLREGDERVLAEYHRQGRILDGNWARYDYGSPIIKPTGMTCDQMMDGFKYVYEGFYSIPSILKRFSPPPSQAAFARRSTHASLR